jgi:hypothetical protein
MNDWFCWTTNFSQTLPPDEVNHLCVLYKVIYEIMSAKIISPAAAE